MEDNFGTRFTLVLAPTNGTADVLAAVREGLSFGARKVNETGPRGLVGPFRHIDYAYFVDREYFPEHDRLCAQEGALLLKALAGNTAVSSEIARLAEQITSYRESFIFEQ